MKTDKTNIRNINVRYAVKPLNTDPIVCPTVFELGVHLIVDCKMIELNSQLIVAG